MIVQHFRIYITEGWLATAHGHFFPIDEFYVPSLKLHINGTTKFLGGPDRYKIRAEEEEEEGEAVFDCPPPELIKECSVSEKTKQMLQNLVQTIEEEVKVQEKLNEIFDIVSVEKI